MRIQKWTSVCAGILFIAAFTIFEPLALAKGGGSFSSSGGGRSFGGGGGSRSFSSPSQSRSFSSPKQPSAPPAAPLRGFSTPTRPPTPVAPSVKSPKSTFDAAGTRAKQQMESQRTYERAHPVTPKQSDYQSQRTTDLRRELSNTRMENRSLRQQQTFGSYYARPTPCCYNDGFNIFFWLWLMDRPQRDRDTWMYNHRDGIDPARYDELKKKDANLENRLHALETQGVQKDPSYVPPGVDRDLMYSDDFVKNISTEKPKHHFPWGWVISAVVLVALVYIIFFFRWRRKSE